MGVMARGALHLVIGKQGFIDALAGEARAVPGGRNRSSVDRQYALGIADVISHRIFQLAVCDREGRVIGEGDRVSGVQIRADLKCRVDVVGRVGTQTANWGINGNGPVMAAQTSQGNTRRSGWHRSIQCWAAVHCERPGGGLMVPQGRDLRGIRIVGGVTWRTCPVSAVPDVIGAGEVVRRTFNTFIDGRP